VKKIGEKLTGVAMEDDSIQEALKFDSLKRIKELLAEEWLDPMEADNQGWTALMSAASMGASKCLAFLLPLSDAKAVTRMQMTPLMWAALSDHKKCVEMLIPVSDVDAKDWGGKTALDLARAEKNKACVEILEVAAHAAAEKRARQLAEGRKALLG